MNQKRISWNHAKMLLEKFLMETATLQMTWIQCSSVPRYFARTPHISGTVKKPWKFVGTFHDGKSCVPQPVYSFLRTNWQTAKWISKGKVHRQLLWIAHIFKTDWQVWYNPATTEASFRSHLGRPLHFTLRVAIHQSTHSKQLTGLLHCFGVCLCYPQILTLENQLANSIAVRRHNDWL